MTLAPNSVGRRLVGGAALLLLTRVVGLAMGLVVMVLTANTLGAKAFGTFAFALALVQIGMTVADLGLGSLIVSEGAQSPDELRSLLLWCLRARLAAGLAVALVLAVITSASVAADEGRLGALLVIASLPITAYWLGQNVLQHLAMLQRLSLLLLAQSVVWLAVVAVLAFRGAGLTAFAGAYLAYSIWYSMLLHFVTRRQLGPVDRRITRQAFGALLRRAVPLSLTVVVVALYYRLDSLFVYRFNGAEAAGAYAVAYRFLDQAQVLPITLCAVFLPLLSRERAAGRPLSTVFSRYLRVSLLTSVPVVGLGMLVARPLVLGVFGADFRASVPLLRLLLLSFVPIMLGYVLGQVAIAHGQYRRQLQVAVIALVLNVAANSALVPAYGPRAAALTTLGTEVFVVAGLYLTLRRPCALKLPVAWLCRLAVATCSAGAAGVALLGHPWPAAGAFAVVFCLIGMSLRLVERGELRMLLPARRNA